MPSNSRDRQNFQYIGQVWKMINKILHVILFVYQKFALDLLPLVLLDRDASKPFVSAWQNPEYLNLISIFSIFYSFLVIIFSRQWKSTDIIIRCFFDTQRKYIVCLIFDFPHFTRFFLMVPTYLFFLPFFSSYFIQTKKKLFICV